MKALNWRGCIAVWFLLIALFAPFHIEAQLAPPGGSSGTTTVLNFWPFSDTNWLAGDGHSPLGFTNLVLSTNGDGNASLLLDSTNTAYLHYAVVETNGHTNLIVNGTNAGISFWFAPSWSSLNQPDGTGPGGWGRLFEVGEFTTNASNGCFSLFLSPDGQSIFFSAEDTNGATTNYLYAPISWQAGDWHFIALTYSPTNNCALYCDGVLLTNGDPLSIFPGQAALTNGFAIGSDFAGAPENQAHGTFDDLYAYNIQLDSSFVPAIYGLFALIDYGVTNFTASAPFISILPTPTNTFSAVTGPGSLQWLGLNTNVSPGGQVYIASPMAGVSSNFTSTFEFSIGGGTNNVPYDLFGTVALVGAITNSEWFWLGQGYTGNTYQLANQPGYSAFYLLGTPQDSDFDGLTDAYERLVSHTDPYNPDTTYSGLGDGWYVYYGLNPLAPTNVQALRLGYWRFNTNSWMGEQGQLPIVATNLSSVTNWSGTAVVVDSSSPANLRYRDFETNGMENINCRNGSVRFWFCPDWDSGTGPGSVGRLLEMGDGTSSGGYWALSVSADGTQVSLQSATNGSTNTYVTGSISFASNTWHQLVITYTPGSGGVTALYVDGSSVASGSAMASWPSAAARAAYGFNLGSSRTGNQQSKGAFDELETFDYPLSSDEIAANYGAIAGLNPVPNAWFTNNFVNVTNVTATIEGSAAAMAVLVNSTNFASASWIPFASNYTVGLGTGDGTRAVYFGFTGLNGAVAWTSQHVTVDTVAPSIVLTNPVAGSTNFQPVIQLQGYCSEALSSISYDLTNTNGLATNQQVLILSQFYDTNTWECTTNFFQAFDVPLAVGTNLFTLHATDRAGNVATSNVTYVLDYSTRTNPPVITLYWPTNSAQISGSTFTWRGHLDDFTDKVTAKTVDTNGNTNVFIGKVERNGNFWLDNLPLTPGTNGLNLTVVDAAGNTNQTNISVVQSTVNLTIDPLSWTNSTVTGTMDTSGYTVWVNGVKATNTGGTAWSAANVLTVHSMTAVVQARAIPNSDNGGNGTGGGGGTNTSYADPGNPDPPDPVEVEAELDMPMGVYFQSYTSSHHEEWPNSDYPNQRDKYTEELTSWSNGSLGTETYDYDYYGGSGPIVKSLYWPASWWPQPLLGGYDWTGSAWEQGNAPISLYEQFADVPYATYAEIYPFAASQQAQMNLFTGGSAVPGQASLIQLAVSVEHLSLPPLYGPWVDDPPSRHLMTSDVNLERATVGNFGHPGSDGYVWTVLPAGTTSDVTVRLPGDNFYESSVTPSNYNLSIVASVGATTMTLYPDTVSTNIFCVGQRPVFSLSPLPTGVTATNFQWSFGGHYFNAGSNSAVGKSFPNCSRSYYIDTNLLAKPTVMNCWWVSGAFNPLTYPASVSFTLIFTNGNPPQRANVSGLFGMARPLAQVNALTTSTIVWNNTNVAGSPLYVQFIQPTPTNDNPGITFYYSLTPPTGFTGSAGWIQTITDTTRAATESNSTVHAIAYPPFPCLDSLPGQIPYPYQGMIGTNAFDAPGQNLTIFPSNYISATGTGSYKMYLEFTPTGGVSVPLQVVNWSWSASVTNSGSGWSLLTATNTPNPNGIDTEEYPIWINNITNSLGWSPGL